MGHHYLALATTTAADTIGRSQIDGLNRATMATTMRAAVAHAVDAMPVHAGIHVDHVQGHVDHVVIRTSVCTCDHVVLSYFFPVTVT